MHPVYRLHFNFQLDRAHGGKPEHVDLTRILSEMGGADTVQVDYNGNVLGGTTNVGGQKLPW